MAGLGRVESGSEWAPGGAYESSTRGPGPTTGRGPRGPRGPGGPGGGFMEMFQSMLAEKQAAARGGRRREEERHSEWMREQRKKRAPKLAGRSAAEKKRASMLDPMRYAQKHGQAARHGQFARGGMGMYGQGQMAMAAAEKKAREEALASYPAYMAMMQGG